MKKTITIIATSLVLGLILGYFIFSNNEKMPENIEKHQHNTEEKVMWTCSMHPQIQKEEPGQCPICGMDLIPMEHKKKSEKFVFEMSEEAVKLAEIQTMKVGMNNGTNASANSISLTGKIQADETKMASVVSHIPGRIEKLYVSFTGEKIYAGQKIADIYSPDLITAQKELLEANKIKDSNPQLFKATVNKLKFWKLTDAQINDIISSNSIKENFAIHSDYSGVVTERKVAVGDHIMAGQVMFKTQNLNKLWVLFDVYEKDLNTIKKGDKIEFTTNASNKKYTTKITFVDPVINPKTRTATVRGIISNSKGNLKPEMFVSGTLASSHKQKTNSKKIVVPKSAVMWTGERSVVYVKIPNTEIPSFDFKEVKLGNAIGGNYEILEGLELGDEVVVNGAFVIDASIQLKNQKSMMNRNPTGKEMKGMSGM